MKKYTIFVIGALFVCTVSVRAQENIYSTDLMVGSSGQDVINLQTWLISNGYDIPAISTHNGSKGYFGEQTRSALSAYQKSMGFPAHGFFGPVTRGQLNKGGDHRGASLRITSPNGGEVWQKGTIQNPLVRNITWTGASGLLNQTATIKLVFPVPACAEPSQPVRCMIAEHEPVSIASGVSLKSGSYAWNVGQVLNNTQSDLQSIEIIADGQYKIQICPTNGSQCDESDSYFNISSSGQPVASTTSAGPLKITSPNGGEVWRKGTIQAVTWTSPYYFKATTADLKLVPYRQPCTTQMCPMYVLAPYTIATNISINQNSYNWNVGSVQPLVPMATNGTYPYPSSNVVPDGQYTLQICESGTSNCDSGDATFTLISAN